MTDIQTIYRHQMIRAVMGTRPAILAKEADTTALDRMCSCLADAEEAKAMLCAKGYGHPSQTLADIVRTLPASWP